MANYGKQLTGEMRESQTFIADFGSVQVVETSDYEKLNNLPSIENVTLIGNKTIDQIGVGTMTVQEIEQILYLD